MACGPSVGVPGGKCLFGDSEALPLPGEPRAVFRVYLQYWLYTPSCPKEGVAALPALLCSASLPQPGFGHCTGTGTVPPAPADVPGAQLPE